ncbi:MAG: hypothetical protein RQ743_01315 [Bacteroidales bacterium]|nr:hypothetical protein [Bacteroidales bacterium]
MKKISEKVYMGFAMIMIFIIQSGVTLAQQPTHYPDEHEPIPPTLVNILVYIGGPILLFIIYYYFRKRKRKKIRDQAKAEIKAKTSTTDKAMQDG